MRIRPLLLAVAIVVGAAACGGDGDDSAEPSSTTTTAPPTTTTTQPRPVNVYEHTQADDLDPRVAAYPPRVYVPNSEADTVTVIDPIAMEIIGTYDVGRLPHHVVPNWQMDTLWVNNTVGNTLTRIDPMTGELGESIYVEDPYNLYFTPDGSYGVVMAERLQRIDFTDPNTFDVIKQVSTPCEGVNHADFSADGTYLIASCEFSGHVLRVNLVTLEVEAVYEIGGKPVDVKLSPDGTVFYVANETRHGVSILDPVAMTEIAFLPAGQGTHGLYPSRDGTQLYATNRLGGSVTVIDFATRQVVATWVTGGSPDMGGVSPDGTRLWLSGRYDAEVYVVDTSTGELITTFPVEAGAHGLAYFPQPGRFSMGHTGNYR